MWIKPGKEVFRYITRFFNPGEFSRWSKRWQASRSRTPIMYRKLPLRLCIQTLVLNLKLVKGLWRSQPKLIIVFVLDKGLMKQYTFGHVLLLLLQKTFVYFSYFKEITSKVLWQNFLNFWTHIFNFSAVQCRNEDCDREKLQQLHLFEGSWIQLPKSLKKFSHL